MTGKVVVIEMVTRKVVVIETRRKNQQKKHQKRNCHSTSGKAVRGRRNGWSLTRHVGRTIYRKKHNLDYRHGSDVNHHMKLP